MQLTIEVDNVEVRGEYRLIGDHGIRLVEIVMHAPYQCHWYVRNCKAHLFGPMRQLNMSCAPFRARLSLELTYRKRKAFDAHFQSKPAPCTLSYPEI